MPIRQKIFFLTIAVVMLIAILELVRRRRLRVEYSWLWILSGVTIVTLILRYDLLIWLTDLVGAVIPTSTLFFLCILYLAMLSLNYSVRLSDLTRQLKEVTQEVALLQAELGLAPDRGSRSAEGGPGSTMSAGLERD